MQPFIPEAIKIPHVTCAQTETSPACDSDGEVDSQPNGDASEKDDKHPDLLTTTTWNLLHDKFYAQTDTDSESDSNNQLDSQPDAPAEGEDPTHPPLLTTTTWNLLKN